MSSSTPSATVSTSSSSTTTAPPSAQQQTATASTTSATHFANCAELNAVYPHGVGRPGAVDHRPSGTLVTNFTEDTAVYEANKGSDVDGDGIACEQK